MNKLQLIKRRLIQPLPSRSPSLRQVLVGTLLMTVSVLAQAQSVKEELQAKLAQLGPFSAEFVQKVTSAEGDDLLTAEGTMQLQRPNQFRWQTMTPDEQLIVSDGKTLWFYNPFVEQVSLYSLNDAIANTPFMLLAGTEQSLWQNYRVTKQGNLYTVITPNDNSSAIFTLQFEQGKIAQFSVQEQQGQHSQFILQNQAPMAKTVAGTFDFVIPADTDIDDQR
ncbi:MAG: outer membrane lipoprotein carrier protein [Moritella sp.]|jgi:outer membrane lipoprotein carrier protein